MQCLWRRSHIDFALFPNREIALMAAYNYVDVNLKIYVINQTLLRYKLLICSNLLFTWVIFNLSRKTV